MYGLDRLIAAGMSADMAWETAYWFAHYGNDSDFERYILEFQNGQRERVNDG